MELVIDLYNNESQTLTTGAEDNMLKFKQLIGVMTEEEEERWELIKERFSRNLYLSGGSDQKDPVSRIESQLSLFNSGLDSIGSTLSETLSKPRTTTLDLGTVGESIEGLRETVASHLSGQEGDDQTQQALGQSLATFQAALEQQQVQFSENAASTREYNHQLAEYLGSSLQALQENISASQSQAQSAQMQSALTNIGNLFSSYQDRNRDLQESLASAQPTEVVVDVSKQMAEDSDALIQQILSQLKEAQQPQQQQAPPENPPPQAEQ